MATLDPSTSPLTPPTADNPLLNSSSSDLSPTLPTFGLFPSPLLTSLQSLASSISVVESERSALLLQRSALLDRVSALEALTLRQQAELSDLRHQVEVLEYGVRHERALRMDDLIARRGREGVSMHRGEEKQAGLEGDEKEQLMLEQGKLAGGKRGRSKRTATTPQYCKYFTLPSHLPAVPLSPGALLKWREYIQGEGRNTNIDVLSHTQREAKLPSASPQPLSLPDEAESSSEQAAPSSPEPVMDASPPSGGEGRVVTGILSAGKRGPKGLKKKKKIQFKGVSSSDDEEEDTRRRQRKVVTHATFVPPAAAADSVDSSTVPASPSSASSADVASPASSSVPSSFSSLSAKSLRAVPSSAVVRSRLVLRFHTAAVRAVAFSSSPSPSSPSSTLIATASEDATINLFALPSSVSSSIAAKKPKPLEPLATYRHRSPVLSVALHQLSGVCVGGTAGGEVDVWSLEGALRGDGVYSSYTECQMGRKGGWKWARSVWSVAINEQGDSIACACADGMVYLLNALQLGSPPLHAVPSPGGEDSLPSSLCFLSAAEVVAGYSNGDVVVIDTSTGDVKPRTSTAVYVTSVCVGPAPAPDSAATPSPRFISGHADGSMRLHSGGADCAVLCVVQAHSDAVTSVSVSAVDGRVASCGHDEMVRLWEVQTRESGTVSLRAVQTLEPHATHRSILGEAIHCVQWSERGMLASAGADGVVKVFA